MNDTPTPRTDAIYESDLPKWDDDDYVPVPAYIRMRKHARQLERELAEARELVEHLKDHCRMRVAALQSQTSELMKAEQQRDSLAEALEQCVEDSVELLGERHWWQMENRRNYQERYNATAENIVRAKEALAAVNGGNE